MQWRYVRHIEVDTARWDAALQQCPNRLLYAETDYLNRLAVHWDAVIGGDYEALMPLPFKQKWGIRYVPVIPFVQQLGVFAKQPLTDEMIQQCITVALRHIRYADFLFNFGNTVVNSARHVNYVLPLSPGYELLSAAYHKDLRNNLKQAAKHGVSYNTESDYHNVIGLFQQQYRQQLPHFKQTHYTAFSGACGFYAMQQAVFCRTVYKNNVLLAGAVLIQSGKRLYNLLSVNTPEGRNCSANHFLYDRLIYEFAGQDLLLDFEGSDVPGIASFYENFGGFNQPYYSLHVNRLPWWVKFFRK